METDETKDCCADPPKECCDATKVSPFHFLIDFVPYASSYFQKPKFDRIRQIIFFYITELL